MIENSLITKCTYNIVLCIDGTGTMKPFIENLKNNISHFYESFAKEIDECFGDYISFNVRVKAIVFRDYLFDGEEAMVESPFYELPSEEEAFVKFINGIEASGGGDNPENGLEALYYAMQSDFTSGFKDRQIIVLFSDADALPLKERAGEGNYPSDMVDMDGFYKTWACQSQTSKSNLRERNKRLLMFAPHNSFYEKLGHSFNRCLFIPESGQFGRGDIDFENIIDYILRVATN